jgi:hypothetical protein
MATYVKFQSFVESLANKEQDLIGSPPTDELKIGLTNTEPNVADTVVNTSLSPDQVQATSNAVELAAGNGYTEGGDALTAPTGTRSGGTVTLAADQNVWTASGSMGPFQFTYLYNNTAGAAATRPAIAYWDYLSSITLNSGETFTVKFSNQASAGTIFTLA